MRTENNSDAEDQLLEDEVLELWTIFSKVINSWRRVVAREVESMSLRPIELRILKLLHDSGENSMNVIAEQVGVTSPWITTEINRLKKKGLVTKNRSQNDRRIIRINLTDEGRKLMERGIRLLVAAVKSNLGLLDPEEMDCLRRTLEKMDISLR